MSQENVDAVRRAWEAWQQGDTAAMYRLYDPEIEWDQSHYTSVELDGVYKGHEGVRRFFSEWLSSFDDYWARVDEFIDAGDSVVVRLVQGGRGKGSGIPVEMPPFMQIYRMRKGRAVRVEVYEDEREALQAAGLEP